MVNKITNYLEEFKYMLNLRGLTNNTVKAYSTYISAFLEFLKIHKCNPPENVSYDLMRSFINQIQSERNLCDRTINSVISQLRFFTLYILHQNWDPTQLPLRKFDTYLPYVPSQKEMRTFLATIQDLKFKAMAVLMYSAGLRVSEVCNLRYEDISRTNMKIHIAHAKNRSDRYAQLSTYALDVLTDYWLKCGKPRNWLFPEKTNNQKPIYTQWVGINIEKHEKFLGWPKHITCHTFRHAYGTHLYEMGADLPTIKVLLGHKSIESTVIYVHLASTSLSKIKNPLDVIMGERNE